MTRRMAFNTHEDAFGFHNEEHEYHESCDAPPRCRPVVEVVEGPQTVTHNNTSQAYDPPPSHYDGGSIDGWAIVDSFGLDFYLGNAMKYIIRCGKKDIAPVLDDLIKARNYINKRIQLEERKNGNDV